MLDTQMIDEMDLTRALSFGEDHVSVPGGSGDSPNTLTARGMMAAPGMTSDDIEGAIQARNVAIQAQIEEDRAKETQVEQDRLKAAEMQEHLNKGGKGDHGINKKRAAFLNSLEKTSQPSFISLITSETLEPKEQPETHTGTAIPTSSVEQSKQDEPEGLLAEAPSLEDDAAAPCMLDPYTMCDDPYTGDAAASLDGNDEITAMDVDSDDDPDFAQQMQLVFGKLQSPPSKGGVSSPQVWSSEEKAPKPMSGSLPATQIDKTAIIWHGPPPPQQLPQMDLPRSPPPPRGHGNIARLPSTDPKEVMAAVEAADMGALQTAAGRQPQLEEPASCSGVGTTVATGAGTGDKVKAEPREHSAEGVQEEEVLDPSDPKWCSSRDGRAAYAQFRRKAESSTEPPPVEILKAYYGVDGGISKGELFKIWHEKGGALCLEITCDMFPN